MSGVYFADNRQLVTVDLLLKAILPTNQSPCTHSYTTRQGMIFEYPREEDVNIFFQLDILNKLKENGLTPDLSHKTQEDRLIIIPNVPEETYYKDSNTILRHINDINDTNILKVDRFITHNKIRYLKIFFDSKLAQTNWIEKGKIKVFQTLHRAEAARNKNKVANPINNHYSQNNYATRSRPGQTQRSALPQNCTWGRPNVPNASTCISSNTHDHRNNRGPHSNWDEARTNRHNLFTGNSFNHSRPYDSDHEIKLFSYTSLRLTESLYNGLEFPDSFTDIFNQILIDNGHNGVNVPHNVKELSRKKFLHSNTRYVSQQNHSLHQMPPPSNYLSEYPPMPPTVKPPTPISSASHPSAPPGTPPPPPPTASAPPMTPASAPPVHPIHSPIASIALLEHPKLPQPEFTHSFPSTSNSTTIISNSLTTSPSITTFITSKSPANSSSIITPIISKSPTTSPSISFHNTSTSNTHNITSISPINLPHNAISYTSKATTSLSSTNPTPIPSTNTQTLPLPLIHLQLIPGSLFSPKPSGSNPPLSHTTPRNTQGSHRRNLTKPPYYIPPYKSSTFSKSIAAIERKESKTQLPSYSLRSLGNSSLLSSSN